MKFKEHKNINFSELSEEILSYWKEKNVFEKSVSEKAGQATFTFYEGPPSANGTPGIHHVMARTVKDIVCRYKTLKGFQVKRKGGWDTHGLPVELQVEKKLGITKEDIGKKISVEDYNKACRESVMEFKSEWDSLTQKMGYWVDLDNPYITFDKEYIETLWFLLKELHNKGYLYKGYTIQPYSPAAGTGLSSHELNQPGTYKEVKDTTIVAQFKIKGTENEYFLAWTTTPWTLPSNSALAVGPTIEYVKIETFNQYTGQPIKVVLAKELIGKFFKEEGKDADFSAFEIGAKVIPWKELASYKGTDLIGTVYEQLMPYVSPEREAFKVIAGDFVSTEDGTGIVHIAPTFGADDKRVADFAGIPAITITRGNQTDLPLVDKQGKFVEEVSDFAGQYVKDEYYTTLPADHKSIDVQIAIKLKEENKAFKVEKYEHTYPHCWRTDKPILYYPLESWFIKTTAVKDRLVELNKTINWKPASTGEGRFGNWLENLVDWNLSRSRFWGTPLPIWRTASGEEELCIGSIEELNAEMKKANAAFADVNNPETLDDLHRPYVDDIILVSPSGEKMMRETDLIDVWFDSGAMPYAQWHYMGDTSVIKDSFPADFIAEGVDQTRGWFFTLHAISVMLFDSVAFKNVIANGLVLDAKGNKMSKRFGNAIDPFDTLSKYGPDATRWYMIGNAPPWDNLKFNLDGVDEVKRRFFGTITNTYNFFALYANLDEFTYQENDLPLSKRHESDRWILSKLHSLIQVVDEKLADYDLTPAVRAIQDFVIDDLSNWYVRLNRKRFWKGEYNEDKLAAYQTLCECLFTIAKIASPIAPFYFDKLYLDLNQVMNKNAKISVHLDQFPQANASYIDKDLENKMAMAQTISSLVHSLRKGESIKVRQPLSRILVPVLNTTQKEQILSVADLIKTEVNIKEIEFVEDNSSDVLVKKVKANFARLGKRFGPKMKLLANQIALMSQEDIKLLETNGSFTFDLEGEKAELVTEDFDIAFQDIPGWLVASDAKITVALDIQITEALRMEGIARDVVNRVQNIRKEMGLDVQDKIKISIQRSEELVNKALETNKEYICTETQALDLCLQDVVANGNAVEMDDKELILKVEL